VLQYSPKKGARLIEKLLSSAVANAREHQGADIDRLWVTGAWASEGRKMKRFMPRSRGSADQIEKRSSHITVVVGERGK
jgi:large subunit ribosomal protein L22